MILGIIAGDVINAVVQTMNFRHAHDIRRIKITALPLMQKEIESAGIYTHILLDVDALAGNSDNAIALLERLLQTTAIQFCVLADGYPDYGRLVQDILALGIPEEDVLLAAGTRLKMRLGKILNADSHAIAAEAPQQENPQATLPCASEILIEPLSIEPPAAIASYSPLPFEPPIDVLPAAPDLPLSIPCEPEPQEIIPPSQITTVQAKQQLRENLLQIQKANLRTATTIAFAGAGTRIGTTTQALQLLMYLRTQNHSAALVEMHGENRLQLYSGVYSNAEIITKTSFKINGNILITNSADLQAVKSEYEYLILDYGEYGRCDTHSFLQNDIKIICAGIKPWETSSLGEVFADEDGTLRYLFSFVPATDEATVLEQMESSASKTFFAGFSPDMFQYCGNDATYESLASCPVEQ